MELYIHYKDLPEGLTLEDFVGELNEVLDDTGVVCGGEDNRLDLDLEDERVNPKHAQMAVKPICSAPASPRRPPWRSASWCRCGASASTPTLI